MSWDIFWCAFLLLSATGARTIVLTRPYSWAVKLAGDCVALAIAYWALTFVIRP